MAPGALWHHCSGAGGVSGAVSALLLTDLSGVDLWGLLWGLAIFPEVKPSEPSLIMVGWDGQ